MTYTQECNAGSKYLGINGINATAVSAGGLWYLNTGLPTSCGGKIIHYELNLDDTNFTLTGDIAIAMWEVNGTAYTKVHG